LWWMGWNFGRADLAEFTIGRDTTKCMALGLNQGFRLE
jgi:hypothetical protein